MSMHALFSSALLLTLAELGRSGCCVFDVNARACSSAILLTLAELGQSGYPSTAKVWQTLNIGQSPRVPNNLIISGVVHGQMPGHCLGVVCQTLPVLRYCVFGAVCVVASSPLCSASHSTPEVNRAEVGALGRRTTDRAITRFIHSSFATSSTDGGAPASNRVGGGL